MSFDSGVCKKCGREGFVDNPDGICFVCHQKAKALPDKPQVPPASIAWVVVLVAAMLFGAGACWLSYRVGYDDGFKNGRWSEFLKPTIGK